MWIYNQATGLLSRDNKKIYTGYSGYGHTLEEGRNNPLMENVAAKGPIPKGLWKITEKYDSNKVGKYALVLVPVGHNAHKRSAFRIHGNNKSNNASNGCIILPLNIRELIWESGDRDLRVV